MSQKLSLQISLLQSMQSRYAKLEFDQARNLWMSFRPGRDGDGEADYEATFATLVEQVSLAHFSLLSASR